MDKFALTAQKSRALAESLGLIPHYRSNWKWALRQMRKTNPLGIKNAPLMQSGRELAMTKERVGKLPNNVLQKIKALQRKQRLGVEVGYNKGRIFAGDIGHIQGKENVVGLRAHTHLKKDKYLNKKWLLDPFVQKDVKDDVGRTFHNIMRASPSGINWKYNPQNMKADQILKKLEINRYRRSKLLSAQYKYENKLTGYGFTDRPLGMYGVTDKVIIEQFGKKHPKLSDALLANRKYQRAAGIRNALATKRLPLIEKYPYQSSDASALRKSTGHNILAKGVTGIHTGRQNLPTGFRSVYFKGGL